MLYLAASLETATLSGPTIIRLTEVVADNAKHVIRRYLHWNDSMHAYSYGCQIVESKVAYDRFNDATQRLTC